MRKNIYIYSVIMVLFVSSCGPLQKQPKDTSDVNGSLDCYLFCGPSIIDASMNASPITRQIIANTEFQNKRMNSLSTNEFTQNDYNADFDLIADKRNEINNQTIAQKSILYGTQYFVNVTLAASGALLGPESGMLVPLVLSGVQFGSDKLFEVSLSNVGREQLSELNTQVKKLADRSLLDVNGENLNEIYNKMINTAKNKLSPEEFTTFTEHFTKEYLLKNSMYLNQLTKDQQKEILEQKIQISEVQKEITNQKKIITTEFYKLGNSFEQYKVLTEKNFKSIQSQNDQNTLLVLGQTNAVGAMVFSGLSVAEKREFLNRPEVKIMLGEKLPAIQNQVEIEYNIQVSIKSLNAASNIINNLGLGGKDFNKIANMGNVALNASLSFLAGGPMGYMQGFSTLSGLLSHQKSESQVMTETILNAMKAYYESIMKGLDSISSQITDFQKQINARLDNIDQNLALMYSLDQVRNQVDMFQDCEISGNKALKLSTADYDRIKNELSGGAISIITKCVESNIHFFDINYTEVKNSEIQKIQGKFTEPYLDNLYVSITNFLKNSGFNKSNKVPDGSYFDPQMVLLATQNLTNNLLWFDILSWIDSENKFILRFVEYKNLAQNIKTQSEQVNRLLYNALDLVNLSIYQQLQLSGLVGTEEFVQQILSDTPAAQVNGLSATLELFKKNSMFASNVLSQIMNELLGRNNYAKLLRNNYSNSGFLNLELNSALQKYIEKNKCSNCKKIDQGIFHFVWLGAERNLTSYDSRSFVLSEIRTDGVLKIKSDQKDNDPVKYQVGLYFQVQMNDKYLYIPVKTETNSEKQNSFIGIQRPILSKLMTQRNNILNALTSRQLGLTLKQDQYQKLFNSLKL